MTSTRTPRFAVAAVAALALFLAAAPPAARADQHEEKPSLYTRLGGYDAIAAVTDDFIGRLLADESLGRFFIGHGTDSKTRIRQLVVDQLCAVTGGPCVYIGGDMKTVHAGLGITKAHWDATVAHLVATLDEFKVPQAEKDELLAIVSTLEADIVDTP